MDSDLATKNAAQVERNYQAFKAIEASLIPAHLGEYALMKDGEVVEFCAAAVDAYRDGG
jgi:hypothetical protein